VVAFHRQDQVRQLEDTWPIDALCIYKFQLAIQVYRGQVHPSRLEPNRKPGLRLAKCQKSLTDAYVSLKDCDVCGFCLDGSSGCFEPCDDICTSIACDCGLGKCNIPWPPPYR
jgi:hypothetical protein